MKTDNYQELYQYWTTVNEKMQEEKSRYESCRGKSDPNEIPTRLAICDVAKEVKLPTERVVWVNEQYAERKLLVQSSVAELIRLGPWSKLADLLYNDAKDLAVTIPPQMEDDIERDVCTHRHRQRQVSLPSRRKEMRTSPKPGEQTTTLSNIGARFAHRPKPERKLKPISLTKQ